MNTNSEVKAPSGDSEPNPVGDPPGIPVERGAWYTICPVCRTEWLDGQAWIDAGGPPCKHLSIHYQFRKDGVCVQWMQITWFPRVRNAARAVVRFLLFPFAATYLTWQARRARRRL